MRQIKQKKPKFQKIENLPEGTTASSFSILSRSEQTEKTTQ
jgi:hypothetical protein